MRRKVPLTVAYSSYTSTQHSQTPAFIMPPKHDVEEFSFSQDAIEEAISPAGIQQGVAALLGKATAPSISEKPAAAALGTTSRRSSVERPEETVNAIDSDLQRYRDDELLRLESRMNTMSLDLEKISRDRSGLMNILEKQSAQVSDMVKTIQRQEVTIASLEAQLKLQQTMHSQSLANLETDLKNRIRDGLSSLKNTPEIIERLMSATNGILATLPSEAVETIKKVELTPQERRTLTNVRQQTAAPKVKIPKHLR